MQIWEHVVLLVVLRNRAGLREQPAANVESCMHFTTPPQDMRHWVIVKVQR